MARGAGLPQSRDRQEGILRKALRAVVLGITLLFVVSALAVSCALVVYTAWRHEFSHGLFALLFAVLSAQIALNWFLWKDDEEYPSAISFQRSASRGIRSSPPTANAPENRLTPADAPANDGRATTLLAEG